MEKAKNAEEYIAQQRMAIASNADCGTSHYNLAVALMGLQKYDEAEAGFQEALECSPNLAEAYVQLGAICLRRNDLEGCLAYNRQAVKVRPGFSEGWGNVGFVEMQNGNIDAAITALKKATLFNFRFVQAFTTLANAYLIKGMIKESIATTLSALKIEPDFPIAHNNLAIAYLENKEPEKAIRHCDRAVELGYDVAPEILSQIEALRG